MGNKTKEEENELIDFLYKDEDCINSFYAQIFQGNLEKVVKSKESKNSSNGEVNGGIGIISGTFTGSDENTEGVMREISPHDAKILTLFNELKYKECNKIEDAKTERINQFHGVVELNSYDLMRTKIEIMRKSEFMGKFLANVDLGRDMRNLGLTLDNLFGAFTDFQPSGCDIVLTLVNNQKILVPLKVEHLMMKPEDIYRAYGTTLPGQWVVIGIFSKMRRPIDDNLINKLFQIENQMKTVAGIKMVTDIVKPILIYRKIR